MVMNDQGWENLNHRWIVVGKKSSATRRLRLFWLLAAPDSHPSNWDPSLANFYLHSRVSCWGMHLNIRYLVGRLWGRNCLGGSRDWLEETAIRLGDYWADFKINNIWQPKMTWGKLLRAFNHPVLVQEDLSLNYYEITWIYLRFGDGFID